MTGIRQSFVFSPETAGFGKGTNETGEIWIAPPPGSFFASTTSVSTTRVNTAGNKRFDTVAYGARQGSWEWTFYLDYDYLEPFLFAFESYTFEDGVHSFTNLNSTRPKSFVVRRKIINDALAGGPTGSDELTELYGCVVRSVRFSKSAGRSETQVSLSGFYTDERMVKGTLDATDYQEYTGNLAEFMCMFIGDTVSEENYVANTESLSLSVENNASPIYNTCTPIATQFYVGLLNYAFSTSCYSNDPSKYKQRVYSGGYDNTKVAPMLKGLKPIPTITLATYDGSMRLDSGGQVSTQSMQNAYNSSANSYTFTITDCVVKSMAWQKGDGSQLQDSLSSAECRDISFKVKSAGYETDINTAAKHRIESPDPA